MNNIQFSFTGYNAPGWIKNLISWINNLLHENPLITASAAPYPTSYMTDISAIPVAMQNQIPDCVENAVTFAKQYGDYKKTGVVPNLSPRFLFNVSNPSENGTSLVTALEKARTIGICEDQYMTNDTTLLYSQFVETPSSQAYANALGHTVTGYMSTLNVKSLDLKSLIYQFGVVLIGVDIDKNWWSPSWNYPNMNPIQPPVDMSDPTLSEHLVVLYGYDANGNYYGRNWWSTAWDNGGDFTINNSYLNSIYEVAVCVD